MLNLPDTLKHDWVETKQGNISFSSNYWCNVNQKKLMGWGEWSTILVHVENLSIH